MTQYIDKSKVVAEIEKKINSTGDTNQWLCGKLEAYREICDLLDALEAKDVDFEKEWARYFEHSGDTAMYLAKHFFELGRYVSIKTKKGK